MSRFTTVLTHEGAANVAAFRRLCLHKTVGSPEVITQRCVGWRWRCDSSPRHRRWNFTTSLLRRDYPDDAEFVPVWADCELEN